MNRKMMREDDDVENMGIMQGFMDSMVADEDEGDEEGGESAAMMMERRPDSPEILMNNLRGDMRSIDARRDELADLVGYQAATETPEQVLAMLQPILAQQGGGGIGALPQSQPMAQGPQPPMMGGAPGMPPPGMPPMPPDAGMPPPPRKVVLPRSWPALAEVHPVCRPRPLARACPRCRLVAVPRCLRPWAWHAAGMCKIFKEGPMRTAPPLLTGPFSLKLQLI